MFFHPDQKLFVLLYPISSMPGGEDLSDTEWWQSPVAPEAVSCCSEDLDSCADSPIFVYTSVL